MTDRHLVNLTGYIGYFCNLVVIVTPVNVCVYTYCVGG